MKKPDAPRGPTQYLHMVHANGMTFPVYAGDFEVDKDGVYFSDKPGAEDSYVVAFVSHPCSVFQVREGLHATHGLPLQHEAKAMTEEDRRP